MKHRPTNSPIIRNVSSQDTTQPEDTEAILHVQHPPSHDQPEEIEFVSSEVDIAEPSIRRKRSRMHVPGPRERHLSAIAHSAMLLNRTTGLLGTLITLVIWLAGRERSPYLRRHATQALFWQLMLAIVQTAFQGSWELLLAANTYWLFFNPLFLNLLTPLITLLTLVIYLFGALIALLAALRAVSGYAWTYPISGRWRLKV